MTLMIDETEIQTFVTSKFHQNHSALPANSSTPYQDSPTTWLKLIPNPRTTVG
jgi:hypothetical protein